MNIPVHRNTDSRACGATTIVSGQANVYVNTLLASVQGDRASHGAGELGATINDGTVWINNKKLVLKGSNASPDLACAPVGPPHCNPFSVGASPNVYACGGGSGGSHSGSPDEAFPDPSGSDLYPSPSSGSGSSSGSSTGSGSSAQAGDGTPLPRPTTDPGGEDSFDPSGYSATDQTSIDELENDSAWQAKITEMEAKYPGLTRAELYDIINGESNFDPSARNPSGASGLFQFMPQSAAELGYNTDQIAQMSPVQQLNVYDEYLDRWNYNGDNHLGMMQAAPAYASRSGGSVIYPVGSAAHTQNPGWRPSNGGHITVQSINDYYNRSS
jgi:hypothetical protein